MPWFYTIQSVSEIFWNIPSYTTVCFNLDLWSLRSSCTVLGGFPFWTAMGSTFVYENGQLMSANGQIFYYFVKHACKEITAKWLGHHCPFLILAADRNVYTYLLHQSWKRSSCWFCFPSDIQFHKKVMQFCLKGCL